MKRVLSITTVLACAVSFTASSIHATPKNNTVAQQQQKKQEVAKHEADIHAAQDHAEQLAKAKQKAIEARTEIAEHNQQKAQAKQKLASESQHSKNAAAVHQAVEHAEAKRSQQNEAREKQANVANNTEVKTKEHNQAEVAAQARRRRQLAILAHDRQDVLNKQIVNRRAADVASAQQAQKALDNHAPKGQKDTSVPLLASASNISRQHEIASKTQLQQQAEKKAVDRNNYEQLQKKYLLEQSLQTARNNALNATNSASTNHVHHPHSRNDNGPLDQWHKDVQRERIDSNTP